MTQALKTGHMQCEPVSPLRNGFYAIKAYDKTVETHPKSIHMYHQHGSLPPFFSFQSFNAKKVAVPPQNGSLPLRIMVNTSPASP
ncbi:hypothetical protein L1987_10082 [Smallanthus sonchifolius]|uniref:Uncharacterized protein n=1 Tax=Smallanthus sonchifolius TaxID=185202 RepID=A0ACB9JR50_9ASTR|nr:hypothetical protein L1987_10082 [Smallanthus sonchifolius]